MLLRQSRLRFHPAVVDLSSGETNRSWRTNAAASHVGGVALFCFPPALTARAENFRTSERSAAFGESSPMRSRRRFSIQTGQRPRAAKKLGDDAVLKQSAPLLLCRSRPQRVWGRQASEMTLRGGGISAASRLRFPPQIYRRRGAKSDVRQPIKRSRRSCGVAVATYEDTNRSGRKICTMRYLGSVAMDNSPRELTCRAEKEPIMANQLGRAPRRQCRLGYFSGGVDGTDEKKTN